MAYPPAYERDYSFTDFETNNPGQPKPGPALDTEFDDVSNALTATQAALALIQRADGALANGIVGEDQLDPTLFDHIADDAVADAEAAAAAAAASAGAAASSASAANGSATAAATSAATASGAAAQSGVSQGIAQDAANEAALSATEADTSADVAVQAANDTAGSVAATEAAVQRAFEWAELLTGPVLPAPPGWPEAVDDGMFSSKWWAIRAREYNSTETIDLGTAGADIGEAFDIWDAIPGNDLGPGQVYATWGTPTQTYVLIDRSNPSDPASWQNITGGPGPPGPGNSLTIGTVTTGAVGSPAAATITGASPNQVLNLTLPTGATGPTGAAGPAGPPNALAIGTVTTGAAGSPADATITGTSPTQTLNLTIPQGIQGVQGIQGIQGPQGIPGDSTGVLTGDSHVTGEWNFDPTTWFGHTAADIAAIKLNPALYINDLFESAHWYARMRAERIDSEPFLQMARLNGTWSGTSPILASQLIARMRFTGSTGEVNSAQVGAQIQVRAPTNWAFGSSHSAIDLQAATPGTISPVTGFSVYGDHTETIQTAFVNFSAAEVASIMAIPGTIWNNDSTDAVHARGRMFLDRLGNYPTLRLLRVNGTWAAPTFVLANEFIGGVWAQSSGGVAAQTWSGATIEFQALENWSASVASAVIRFAAAPPGTTNPVLSMQVRGDRTENYPVSYFRYTAADAATLATMTAFADSTDGINVQRRANLMHVGGASSLNLRRTNGSLAAPTPALVGDFIGAIQYQSIASATLGANCVGLNAFATQNWSATNAPAALHVYLTPPGTTTMGSYFQFVASSGGGPHFQQDGPAGAQATHYFMGGENSTILWMNKDAAANAKRWTWQLVSGSLYLRCNDDVGGVQTFAIFSRSGISPSTAEFNSILNVIAPANQLVNLRNTAATGHCYMGFYPMSGTREGYIGFSPADYFNIVNERAGGYVNIQASSVVQASASNGVRLVNGTALYLFNVGNTFAHSVLVDGNSDLSINANGSSTTNLVLRAGNSGYIDLVQVAYFRNGLYFTGSLNTGLNGGSGGSLRVTTPYGNIEIGPQNAAYCHVYTDRPAFYFNAPLVVAGPIGRASQGTFTHYADAALASGVVTIVSSAPSSGGQIGDQWLVV